MKRCALALAALVCSFVLAAAAPALAIEVGTSNTVTQTVTTGHLSISEVDNHWDCGYQDVFQVSGSLTLQGGGGGQHGGLTSTNFGDGDGYVGISGSGNLSITHENFEDHNVTTQSFSGTQTTSSSTLTSSTFTNF